MPSYDVDHGHQDKGPPIKVGGVARSGLPAAVPEGARADLLLDQYGRLQLPATAVPNTDTAPEVVRESQGSHQERYEFLPTAAAPTTIYQGFAARGAAEGDTVWKIAKIVFSRGAPASKQWATGVAWTDRASATYT